MEKQDPFEKVATAEREVTEAKKGYEAAVASFRETCRGMETSVLKALSAVIAEEIAARVREEMKQLPKRDER